MPWVSSMRARRKSKRKFRPGERPASEGGPYKKTQDGGVKPPLQSNVVVGQNEMDWSGLNCLETGLKLGLWWLTRMV